MRDAPGGQDSDGCSYEGRYDEWVPWLFRIDDSAIDYFIIVYLINILIDCSFLKPFEVDLDRGKGINIS